MEGFYDMGNEKNPRERSKILCRESQYVRKEASKSLNEWFAWKKLKRYWEGFPLFLHILILPLLLTQSLQNTIASPYPQHSIQSPLKIHRNIHSPLFCPTPSLNPSFPLSHP